jgi:magnesium-transporting ATPase (P-type)
MTTQDATNRRMEMFPFHASSKEECYKFLEVGHNAAYDRSGLTTAQAKERLEKYGYNKLSEKTKKTIWQRIWHQVANVLVGILVFVAAVSAAQAIRFATVEPNKENVITNSIQVGLIAFVIMYVYFSRDHFTNPICPT